MVHSQEWSEGMEGEEGEGGEGGKSQMKSGRGREERRDFEGRGGAKHVEYALLMQTGRSSSYYISLLVPLFSLSTNMVDYL